MFYAFKGVAPVVSPKAYVHPSATIIGSVLIMDNVYVGPGAVLRGDWGKIIIHENANIQETCVIHSFPGVNVIIEPFAHIGHGAIIHGARIGTNCLIGMNAVVMDEAMVESNAVVGALSFVPAKMVIPSGVLAVGNPVVLKKIVDSEFLDWKKRGTMVYIDLAKSADRDIVPCAPSELIEAEAQKIDPQQPPDFSVYVK
jgi:phenylacetic acid degradation protein